MKEDLEDKQSAGSDVTGLDRGGEPLVKPPLMKTLHSIIEYLYRAIFIFLTRGRSHQDQEWVDDGVDEAGADLPPLDGGQAHVSRAIRGVGDQVQDGVTRPRLLHHSMGSLHCPFLCFEIVVSPIFFTDSTADFLLLVTKYRASSDDRCCVLGTVSLSLVG